MSERRPEGDPGFTRVAIVNRGEAAARLIRAVRELNLEHGCGMRTIALHTQAERRAKFVREADAVIIGGERPYLDHALRVGSIDAIIPAARLRPHLIEAVERGIAHTLEPSLQEADRG